MMKNLNIRLKQLLAILLIVIMATPTTALAAVPNYYDEGAIWADLPVIEPIDIGPPEFTNHAPTMTELIDEYLMSRAEVTGRFDMDDICMLSVMESFAALASEEHLMTIEEADALLPQNELSELAPEVLEEILRTRMDYLSQDFYLQQVAALSPLTDSDATFSGLTEYERQQIFRQLDIAVNAYAITAELFTIMERDGFTLSDSIELVRIMSSGLFGYTEAQAILTSIPSSQEREAELARFENFAQGFDIAAEVNARRLVNRPFISINGFDINVAAELGDISLFMNSENFHIPYSFIETAQMDDWNRLDSWQAERDQLEIDENLPEPDEADPEEYLPEEPERESEDYHPQQDVPEQDVYIPGVDESEPAAYILGLEEFELVDFIMMSEESKLDDYTVGSEESKQDESIPEQEEPKPDGYTPESAEPETDEYVPESEEPEVDEYTPEPEEPETDEYDPELEEPETDELPPIHDEPNRENHPIINFPDLGLENAIQYRPWVGQMSHDYWETRQSIFVAFTNQRAFNEARQMFLSNHSVLEIETAFALGAALQVEPYTFMLQPGVFHDMLVAQAMDATAIVPDYRLETSGMFVEGEARVHHRQPAALRPLDFDLLAFSIPSSIHELDAILAYGRAILNISESEAPLAITPLSTLPHLVVNPFAIDFGANESVSLNTGASIYRTHILSLPGRGGFGFNLDLVYTSARADFRRLTPGAGASQPRRNIHGLGVGWIYDLPYLFHDELYVPGRGSFALNGNTIVDYHLLDMRLHNDTTFVSGSLRSTRRLQFHNGTAYFFHNEFIIGMRDRFNNTIRFEYAHIAAFGNALLLTRIIDSIGQVISFSYQAVVSDRVITITTPAQTTYRINLNRIHEDFVLSSITNQAGSFTWFQYHIPPIHYCFNTKSPRHRTYMALLQNVNYPSGAQLDIRYSQATINMGVMGSRNTFRVMSRMHVSNGRQYMRTSFAYFGDHTAFVQGTNRDRPPVGYHYSVVITQNNGLSTSYTFNHQHLNQRKTVANASGVIMTAYDFGYHASTNRLPTVIVRAVYRGNFRGVTSQHFTYDQYGQLIRSINPLAHGSTNTRYVTDYVFDSRFGLMTRMTYRPDANTTVQHVNTLSADGRSIIRTNIYQNGARLSRTDFFHDQFGNIIEIREFPDSIGSAFITTQLTYSNGFTLPASIRTTNVRDSYGNLAHGNGIVEHRFSYDSLGRVVSETDPNGYTTTRIFDGIGRITRINHPDGGFETFVYNDLFNTLHHRTVLGATYIHQFDPLGNLLTITAPGNAVVHRNIYDNRMRIIETQNFQGIASSQRTTFAYDLFDRVTITRALTPAGSTMNQVTIRYDDVIDHAGNSRIVTTQLGNSVNAPSIETFVLFDRVGRMIQEGTTGGRIIHYTHDLIGRVTRETSLGINNTFTYNIHGVTSVRNIDGNTASNVYDHMGRLIRSYDFRRSPQMFTYDALGRLIRHYKPVSTHANGTPYHTITTYQYDRNGNVTRTATLVNLQFQARQWAETVNTFRHNRLITTRTGGTAANNGITTQFTYDLAGNILTQRVGHPSTSNTIATTTFAYDNRGRLTRITDALGQAETFTYDQNSLVLTHTDRNGVSVTYSYDNMGRVVQRRAVVSNVHSDIEFKGYYMTGAVEFRQLFGPSIHHLISYVYDGQGRIALQTETGNIRHYFTYNAADNITLHRTSVGGITFMYETIIYDAAQRVQQRRTHNGWLAGEVLATYSYDANSNIVGITRGNGISTLYTFNLANQVISVWNNRGSLVISRFNYTRFLDGNIHTVNESYHGTNLNRTITYTYDMARRLTREQMVITGSTTRVRTFEYDARGNRTRMVSTGGSLHNYTVNNLYDLNNRLTRETRTGTGASITNFSYDRNGNQLTSNTGGIVETRTYNGLNMLTRVTRPGMTADYTYRADGLRHTRNVNGHRVEHVWVKGQIVLERNAGGQVFNMFHIGLAINHRIFSHHHGYYLYNGRGDVVQRVDLNGNVIMTYRYDAFGNEIFADGLTAPPDSPVANNNPFRFSGEYWDWERGEYYLRFRSYNPRTGRFTQPDPWWGIHNMQDCNLSILQSANLFVYVMSNPVNWRDPWGLFAWNEHNNHIFWLRYEVEKAGGSITSWCPVTYTAFVSIFGVNTSFRSGDPGIMIHPTGRMQVTAPAFYSAVVNAAGGYMTFLGGHPAGAGTPMALANSLHMYVKMFVAYGSSHWASRYFYNDGNPNTRWGLRYATLGGTTVGMRLQIRGNMPNDLAWNNRTYWRHLDSSVGGINRMLSAHESQGRGWIYASPFVRGVRGVHVSNNILSGLLHVAGIHPGPLGQRAIGWDQPTPRSFFGRQ